RGGPDRPGLPERTVEYAREVRSELQKVAWPGRTEVANYTVVVLVTIVVFTALVFGLDYGFAKGIIYLFKK
ncbi:MAG: preprotein translocase subunit SecE, partial [Acidimicrobiales bacterium]